MVAEGCIIPGIYLLLLRSFVYLDKYICWQIYCVFMDWILEKLNPCVSKSLRIIHHLS